MMDYVYLALFLMFLLALLLALIYVMLMMLHKILPKSITCDAMNWHADLVNVNYDDLDGDNTIDIVGRCVKCRRLVILSKDGEWLYISEDMEQLWIEDYKKEHNL